MAMHVAMGVAILGLVSLSVAADIEQRYVTGWDVEPVARMHLAEDFELTGVRCRLHIDGQYGAWWTGTQVSYARGPQTWHLPLKDLRPGNYTVQHDLRTPLGADWRDGVLRVPAVARYAGEKIAFDGELSEWPQHRYGVVKQDWGDLWFAWDMESLYIGRPRGARGVLQLDFDLQPGRNYHRVIEVPEGMREYALPWISLWPAAPLLGQVLRLNNPDDPYGGIDLLFVGSGLPMYFGATWVSGAAGHDDQGPPPAVLRSLEDRIPGFTLRSGGAGWASVQPSPDAEPDWSALNRVAAFTYPGLVYTHIDTWVPWGEELQRADPARFAALRHEFIREYARRCAERGILYFSCGFNEPELFHVTNREAFFLEDLNPVVAAIREGAPDAKIIAGKFSGGAPNLIRSFYRGGFRDQFDVLDIHPYANDPRTGCAMGGVVAAREALVELGMGHKRIYLGEGWGPTRNCPQVSRERHDAPVSAEEADIMRQYYWNGYRCLTSPRMDYNPEWVLGAKFFTLNDNVGMTYWRVSARPHYNAQGEIEYYLLSHLAFRSLDEMQASFWNGGLVDFYGNPKGDWLFDFPPSLPQVRIRADFDRQYMLRDHSTPIQVWIANAEREAISDLALGVRHRTETFRDGSVSGEPAYDLPRELAGLGEMIVPVTARVAGGYPGALRLAVELDYTWRGRRYVADAIIRTELRDDVSVALDPGRIVLQPDETEARARVELRNNTERILSGPLFAQVSAGLRAETSVMDVVLRPNETRVVPVLIDAAGAPPGLYTLDLAWGKHQGMLVQRVLLCPRMPVRPAIDADLSDWPRRDSFQGAILPTGALGLDTLDLQVPFPVPTPQSLDADVAPLPRPTLAADLNARAVCAWDDEYFYFGAVVDDEVHHQPWDGMDVWKGDSIQLAFDPLHDGAPDRPASLLETRARIYEEGYGDDDYELGIALTPNGPQASVIRGPAGVSTGVIEGALAAVRHGGGRTTYEVALPWDALPPLRGADGATIGMDLLVNDSDGEHRLTLGWADAIANGKYPSRYVPTRFTLD